MSSGKEEEKEEEEEEDDEVPLPGFRFHPTDEELVGFYLRRKVEKRPLSIELIKQVDIYKYDPWDLPRSSNSNVEEKEWYFFCKRGRKYRNSVRPNRVITGSGFWKATGIDKQIYSSEGSLDCIGLKKSLVYYQGSAGKGTKTDWMMHEFRLPPGPDKGTKNNIVDTKTIAREAEVWTLCRILKRNNSNKKVVMAADWREVATKGSNNDVSHSIVDTSSETCSLESCDKIGHNISFSSSAPVISHQNFQHQCQYEKKPYACNVDCTMNSNQQVQGQYFMSSVKSQAPSSSSSMCADINHEFLRNAENWEDLQSIVDYAAYAAATHPFYL